MTSLADRNAATPESVVADGRPTPRGRPSPRPSGARYVPLLYRIAGINALLVIAAVAVTIVVVAPAKVSALALNEEVGVLLAAVCMTTLANVVLLRRMVGPVQALTEFARQVDYGNLGQRIRGAEPSSEAGELALTFNEMLSRLEAERRESTGRVLRGQEAERVRIAQELHDQVGQELTAVLLGLSRVGSRAPSSVREDVLAVQDAVRHSLEDVRRIATQLRPEALDELGLASALAVLGERFSEQLDLDVSVFIPPELPTLSSEIELVVYRVAQEALTNVARHSASSRADLTLSQADGGLILTVRDYGLGLAPGTVPGAGMRGMRERAALIGATVEMRDRRSGSGCEVRLEVPLSEAAQSASELER